MPGKIFINYRRGDDAGFTQALYQRIEEVFPPTDVFMDVEGSIKPGDDFVEVLNTQVGACDVMLVIIGPRWSKLLAERIADSADFVAIEIKTAIAMGKRVIPVLVGGASMPHTDELPEAIQPLARRNAVGLRPERFRADCQALITALKEQLAAAVKERAARTEAERTVAEAHRLEREAEEAARIVAVEERARAQRLAGMSPEEVRKAEELANWEFIKERGQPQALLDHLARFPSGVTTNYARAKLEELVWDGITLARTAPTAETLHAFLNEFPNGTNADEARALLADLQRQAAEAKTADEQRRQETEAWGAVAASKEPGPIETFLSQWPRGQYPSAARARIAELRFGPGTLRRRIPLGVGIIVVSLFAAGTVVRVFDIHLPRDRETGVVADATKAEGTKVEGTKVEALAPPAGVPVWEQSVRIRRRPDGHFIAKTQINGLSFVMLIDTSASMVVLKPADAQRLGMDVDRLKYTRPVQTANGNTYAAYVRLRTVAVGPISLNDVEALVAKPGALTENLLGMTFLSRLQYEFTRDILTLRTMQSEAKTEAARRGDLLKSDRMLVPMPCDGVATLVGNERRCLTQKDSFKDCFTCPEMVVIPSGSFTMGSPGDEPERRSDEVNVSVSIASPFAVGKYAITFEEWDICAAEGGCNGYSPDDQGWGRGKHPVINVSWDDARSYVGWLSRKTGKNYRLLSEAEREYVTRAGTTTPFWWGSSITSKQANYNADRAYEGGGSKGEYRQRTVLVDSFEPNPWGVYNVHGNVLEWVEDCWNTSNIGNPGNARARTTGDCSTRAVRGGSWFNFPQYLRSADRGGYSTVARLIYVGLRVARTLGDAAAPNLSSSMPGVSVECSEAMHKEAMRKAGGPVGLTSEELACLPPLTK
jgi:clan AA aspartic protease (TIGR02281 family)